MLGLLPLGFQRDQILVCTSSIGSYFCALTVLVQQFFRCLKKSKLKKKTKQQTLICVIKAAQSGLISKQVLAKVL